MHHGGHDFRFGDGVGVARRGPQRRQCKWPDFTDFGESQRRERWELYRGRRPEDGCRAEREDRFGTGCLQRRRRRLRRVVERPGSPEQFRRVPVRGQRPGQGVRLWPTRSGWARVSGSQWSARLVVRGGRGNGGGGGPAAVGRGRRRVLRGPG